MCWILSKYIFLRKFVAMYLFYDFLSSVNCGWREEKCVEDCVSFKEEFFNDPL